MCDLGFTGSDPSTTDTSATDRPTEDEPAVDTPTSTEEHASTAADVIDTSWRGRRTCVPRGWFGPSTQRTSAG